MMEKAIKTVSLYRKKYEGASPGRISKKRSSNPTTNKK